MRQILKNIKLLTIGLVLFFVNVASGQNYIGFELIGLDQTNLDFTPLDDTITKLNDIGYDVKIIGYYNISKHTNLAEYQQLEYQISTSKQVIVRLIITDDKISVIAKIRNDELENFLVEKLEKIVTNSLTNKISFISPDKLIIDVSHAISLIYNNDILNGELGGIHGNRNNEEFRLILFLRC